MEPMMEWVEGVGWLALIFSRKVRLDLLVGLVLVYFRQGTELLALATIETNVIESPPISQENCLPFPRRIASESSFDKKAVIDLASSSLQSSISASRTKFGNGRSRFGRTDSFIDKPGFELDGCLTSTSANFPIRCCQKLCARLDRRRRFV